MSARHEIIEKLKQVIDPEIGLNIVDLGLIYWVELDDQNTAIVKMTLTTQGCPLTDFFLSEIETQLIELDYVEDVEIEFVWTPAWDLTMIDEKAKQEMFHNLKPE